MTEPPVKLGEEVIMKINERVNDEVAILDLIGPLDCGSGDQSFQKALEQLTARGIVRVVVNLKDAGHLDTACLGVIVAAHVRFRRWNGGVSLLHTPERIRQLLSVARLNHVFASFDTEEDALRAFSGSVGTR